MQSDLFGIHIRVRGRKALPALTTFKARESHCNRRQARRRSQRSQKGSVLRDGMMGSGIRATSPLNTQATNRDEQASRRRMISSILLIISSIDLVYAGGTTSKEQSHLEQCQK